MTREEIETAVKAVVKEQVSGEIKVKLTDDLVENLGFDALDHVEFVMELEDRFGVYISNEEEDAIITVQDAVDLMTKVLLANIPRS